MKKTSGETKPAKKILDLRNKQHELLVEKKCIEESIFQVRSLLIQAVAAQSRQQQQRRAGLPISEFENIDTERQHVHLEAMAGLLRNIENGISDLEKKITFLEGEASGVTKAAKAGASGRKNKYAAMKAIALEWYRQERHRFQNKDDAAIEIIKAHAVEFSTARGWLKGV